MGGRLAPANSIIVSYFVILAVATLAAYSDIFQHDILRWDDNIYLNSKLVQSLSWGNLLAIFSEQHHSNWHPITTLSFAIEHAIWGINATYSKLINIFLHLINVLLFYFLSYRLLLLSTSEKSPTNRSRMLTTLLEDKKRFAIVSSLTAAAVFALHPQHVESVAWVSERKGLLCAVFFLSSLIAYIIAETESNRKFSNLALIFALCALMSKPIAVSLPIVLVLLDIYPLKKVPTPIFSSDTVFTLLRGKLPFFALSLASGIITLLFQDAQSSAVLGYIPRLVNASAAYLHYLTSIFYPENLSPFYPFQKISLEPSTYSIFPVLMFLSLVTLVVVLFIKRIHFPLIIFAFYVISLLPVIGIVKVGYQSMADRYAYLSTIWFYLLIGIAIYAVYSKLKETNHQFLVVVLFIGLCSSLGFTTHEQTKNWQSDVNLWNRVIDIYPNSASIAYINLASAHDAQASMGVEQIGELINKALSISPDDPYSLASAANYHGQLGNEQKTLDYLLKLISVAPYNYWALTQLGDIYFTRNQYAIAGNYYLEAIKQGSDSEDVIYRLALIDYYYNRFSEALTKLDLLTSPEISAKQKKLYSQIQKAITQ